MSRRPKPNHIENLMARALDTKSVLDEVSDQIIPILAQAMREGWSDEKLANHPRIQLLLTARQISIALQEEDSAKALAAIKDTKDRTRGKPTERVETTHKLSKLPDEQLDSLLLSKLGSAAPDGDETDPH
jgi:hypothetical protein